MNKEILYKKQFGYFKCEVIRYSMDKYQSVKLCIDYLRFREIQFSFRITPEELDDDFIFKYMYNSIMDIIEGDLPFSKRKLEIVYSDLESLRIDYQINKVLE